MESEAQWKEVIELSKQVHGIAEESLKKFLGEDDHLRPHSKSAELFLSVFKTILSKRNDVTQSKKNACKMAIQRVKFTGDMVDNMKKEIVKDKDQIRACIEEAERCAEEIKKETEEAIKLNKKIAEEKLEEDESTAASRKLKAECEAELAAVMPAIEQALKSLDLIKPKDISEIKSMKNPPVVVKIVIAAVCVMLEIQPEQGKTGKESLQDLLWKPAQKMLGDVNFMRKLRDYDKDNIKPSVMDTLRAEFYNKPEFEPTRVARASTAAESLCRWITAMEKYDKVSKEILKPKMEALAKAQEQLGSTLEAMQKNKSKLTGVEQNVTDLEKKLAENEEKKKSFEQAMEQKDKALERAKELIDGLKEESNKWNDILNEARKLYDTMVGDCMLTAAYVVFFGVLPDSYRKEAEEQIGSLIANSRENIKWSGKDNFILHEYSNTVIKLETWRAADYPQDAYWLDNATIVDMLSKRQYYPLCVDPLGLVNKWIRYMEKDSNLTTAKQGDENLKEVLKECMKDGRPLLIEDITEKFDTQEWEFLLARRCAKSTAVDSVKIDDEEVPVSEDFKLYMTTRMRCLKPFFYYEPDEERDREANFSVINFVPTDVDDKALQHALLSGVVSKEKRKLEQERLATIEKVALHKKKFIEIGDQVLDVLSNPKGGRMIGVDMTLNVIEAKNPIAEMTKQMEEDQAAMEKIEKSLGPFRKLTDKLAKKFCNVSEEDETTPFDLEAFIKKAL